MRKSQIKSENIFIEASGWIGISLIIIAYALVSFSILDPKDILYPLLSGIGSLGVLIEALKKKDYQPATLNTIWLGIALIAIARILL